MYKAIYSTVEKKLKISSPVGKKNGVLFNYQIFIFLDIYTSAGVTAEMPWVKEEKIVLILI